ncbi:TPA: ArsR/SmtB family transcription factor [Photobacterium damselae]
MTDPCNRHSCKALTATEDQLAKEQDVAFQAKALAHPARVRILSILLELHSLNGCLNSDLVSELGLAQSTVSEHLRILKQAEFIIAEPNPPKVCYRINLTQVEQFKRLFSALFNQ